VLGATLPIAETSREELEHPHPRFVTFRTASCVQSRETPTPGSRPRCGGALRGPPPPTISGRRPHEQDKFQPHLTPSVTRGRRGRSATSNMAQNSPMKEPLYRGKTNSINMRELRVSGHIRRVGNGLALLIPVAEARRAGLSAGDPVDAVIQSGVTDAFGLLKDLPYRPFQRSKEGLWRERV
jgi:hypothetical protein